MKGEKTMLKRQKNFRSLCMTIGLATALTFMIVSPASAIELPGPDEFGYIINQIEGNLRELSTHENTVHLTLGDDAVSEPIPLPAHISSGYISHATIVGEDGNQEFVVEFEKVPHYLNESPLTFQIILHEGSNNIELQYGEAMGDSDSQPFTVGIENDDGTMGMQIVHGDASFDNEGFLISNPLIEEFEVQSANVSLGRGQELDKYDIMGAFTLSDFSDGAIDPIGEGVTIKVGTSSLTIPPNSFEAKQGKSGVEFQGSIDGALVHVSIEAVGALSFRYHVEAHKVDLSDSTIPLKFSLKMGTNVGVTTIPLHGYLRTGKSIIILDLTQTSITVPVASGIIAAPIAKQIILSL
jgi:hypothetical protein